MIDDSSNGQPAKYYYNFIRMDLIAKIQGQQQPAAATEDKTKEGTQAPQLDIKKLLQSILDDELDQMNRQRDPELIRIKNNLLLVLLVLSAYGVYSLIGDFLDVLLVAYIAGIAYHQISQRFTQFLTDPRSFQGSAGSLPKRVVKIVGCIVVGFFFPRVRYLLTHPHKITSFPTVGECIRSIEKTNNYAVITCEVLLGMYIFYLSFGKIAGALCQKVVPTNAKHIRVLFAMIVLLLVISLVVAIPTVFFKEVTNVGRLVQQQIEQRLGCEMVSFRDDGNSTMPLCTDKITSENQFIKETVQEFKEQNKTLEDCLFFLEKVQEEYLAQYVNRYPAISQNIYYYEEIACTWYSFVEKAVSYSGIALEANSEGLHKVFSTGSSLFKLFFGNLAWILATVSNSLFNLTTFTTTFILTSKYYSKSSKIKEIFSFSKQELISSITDLMQATMLIVVEHFIISLMLLEIFEMTPINLIVSTVLASMAMFPFFRPWIGVLFVSLIRMLLVQEYYICILFVLLYYLMSEKIYSIHYRKMGLHEIVTNMSVLFGIYRFGVAGVIYGPMIIITYQCVQRELFRKYIGQKNDVLL